ncbi:MAG: hypothetical protein IMZ67_05990 [Acidobacteria bacterium]|nr:hypothetical protein [Acidobacteriota bacterium]
MATTEKPRATDAARPEVRRQADAGAAPSAAVVEAARSAAKDVLFEQRPYLRMAFGNPYNLSLFLGALVAAGLTFNPFLGLAAVGLEALWLLHAPDSKRLRHLLWDPRFEKVRIALQEQQRAERVRTLGQEDRVRVSHLVARQREIQRLAAENPSFTGDLLRGELIKTDRLVEAFIDMAVTSSRYEQYLDSVDLAGLDRERARLEREVRNTEGDGGHVGLVKKNLAIILKRLEKMKEIQRYLGVARGQLDLIENSFQLITDQIVTMRSPQELSGQLNELLDGVESIRQAAAETDQLLNTLGLGTTT